MHLQKFTFRCGPLTFRSWREVRIFDFPALFIFSPRVSSWVKISHGLPPYTEESKKYNNALLVVPESLSYCSVDAHLIYHWQLRRRISHIWHQFYVLDILISIKMFNIHIRIKTWRHFNICYSIKSICNIRIVHMFSNFYKTLVQNFLFCEESCSIAHSFQKNFSDMGVTGTTSRLGKLICFELACIINYWKDL